jgi:outer membrane protein assembly factor BamB
MKMPQKLDGVEIKQRVSLGSGRDVVLIDTTRLDSRAKLQGMHRRNVFLIDDRTSHVIWQVEDGWESHGSIGYRDIYIHSDGTLLAGTADGIEHTLDRETGRTLRKELIR